MQTPLCIQSPIEWFNNEVIFITMTSINAEKALPTVYGKLLRNPAHWQILIAIVQFSNTDKPRAIQLIWTLSHFILMTCCVWRNAKKSCTTRYFFFQWSNYQEFFTTKDFFGAKILPWNVIFWSLIQLLSKNCCIYKYTGMYTYWTWKHILSNFWQIC